MESAVSSYCVPQIPLEAVLKTSFPNPGDLEKVRALYRRVLSRDPSERELTLASQYLATGTLTDYAHALLCTNEVIYWP